MHGMFGTVGEECYSIEHVPNDGVFCKFIQTCGKVQKYKHDCTCTKQ